MLGIYENIDRYKKDPKSEPIDVIVPTLDAEKFLEKFLDSVYREVPVRRLIVCDGGSKDRTVEILSKYPRVEIHIRPDIKTTGKVYEFLLSKVETEWFALFDADVELPKGWYDEMCKYKDRYDFFECKRIMAYEFYREVPATVDINARPYSGCQLGRKEAFKTYKCDDDYIWRIADIYARKVVEKAGYNYGKVSTTYHFHHTTEGLRYKSDKMKGRYSVIVFKEPKTVVLDRDEWNKVLNKEAKAIVKYLDPGISYLGGTTRSIGALIIRLDREWVQKNGPTWMERWKRAKCDVVFRKLFLPLMDRYRDSLNRSIFYRSMSSLFKYILTRRKRKDTRRV